MIEVTVLENKLQEQPTEESILNAFDKLCDVARKNFLRDSELMPMFVIVCLDGPSHCPCEMVIPAPWHSREEKFEYMDFIRKMAGDTMAVAVIHIGECWFSHIPLEPGTTAKEAVEKHQYKQASQDPNRKEIVQVCMASSLTRPRNKTRFAYVHRGGRKPRLGPWESHENDGARFEGALFDLLPTRGD